MESEPGRGHRGERWIALGLELIAIVAGVLLALALNSWREQRALDTEMARAMTRLGQEISQNRSEFKSFMVTLEQRMQHLKARGGDLDTTRTLIDQEGFEGFPFPELKDSVWQRVSHDPIANRMPPEFIEGAFRLYSYNQLQADAAQAVREFIYSPMFVDPQQTVLAYRIAMLLYQQQCDWGEQGLKAYDDFVARLPQWQTG